MIADPARQQARDRVARLVLLHGIAHWDTPVSTGQVEHVQEASRVDAATGVGFFGFDATGPLLQRVD